MSEEPRRSGRATKGQHTKNHDSETPAPATKRRGSKKSAKASQEPEDAEPEEEEQDAIVRCVCGATDDEGGYTMICCDNCEAWQHNSCMGLPEDQSLCPDTYYCEQCRPDDHKELLDLMARGERIIPPAERKKGKRRSRGGRKGKDDSQAPSEVESPSVNKSQTAKAVADVAPKRKPGVVDSPVQSAVRTNQVISNQPIDSSGSQPPTAVPADTKTAVQDKKSPIQAKRRASALNAAENGTSKRRKSAVEVTESADPNNVPVASGLDKLSDERKKVASVLHRDLSDLIRKASKDGYRIPDGETADSVGERFAVEIEYALYGKKLQGQDTFYGEQFRSIRFNIKKNHTLFQRLLQGEMSPMELADMSSDDMASEDLQKEMRAMKDEADKQATLVQDDRPRIRKTHKGEEIIEDDNADRGDETLPPSAPVRRRPDEDQDMKDISDDHDDASNTVELPDDAVQPQLAALQTAPGPQDTPPSAHRSSFDVGAVWSSVHSPKQGQGQFRKQSVQRPSKTPGQEPTPTSQVEDPDVDRLLKDDEGEESGFDEVAAIATRDPSVAFFREFKHGTDVKFFGLARHVAGANVLQMFPEKDIVPAPVSIVGRMGVKDGDDYFYHLSSSHTTDISIYSLAPGPRDTDRHWYDYVFRYFTDRHRWGVVADDSFHPPVNDMYLIPLPAGPAPLPRLFQTLNLNRLPSPRPEPTLLLAIAVHTAKPLGLPPGDPALLAPVTDSSYPPGTGTFAPGDVPAPAHPAFPPLAAEILAPFLDAPVVRQLAPKLHEMAREQLMNLRHVLEQRPDLREDMVVLTNYIKSANAGSA
ncbi:hypothetical protein P152DRAFT_448642 [Eremomyces bilateralis CBS 781.70]|uniref:Transcription factor BYE1 n=1 Tax=Eremomyces bilateralis CBS 781.70 TaxID=1392243 RepID=A0A6G1G5W0_9PEZI|nr:uncharacterized protein P152DRAFT_448642 [Eremomyces bilateralis CBS 781.70]KAF1813331.1 hypothetical protein P152DRAFT_448642 [Eremomyces bilateralis CBS 781.70]